MIFYFAGFCRNFGVGSDSFSTLKLPEQYTQNTIPGINHSIFTSIFATLKAESKQYI